MEKEAWMILGVCIVLTILISIGTVFITGNVFLSHPQTVYTKDEVNTLIQNLRTDTNYYTKSQVDNLINNIPTSLNISHITNIIDNGTYTKAEIDSKINNLSISNTSGSVISKLAVLQMLNKCQPSWDLIPIKVATGGEWSGREGEVNFTTCDDICSKYNNISYCINAVAIYWKDAGNAHTVSNRYPTFSYNMACNTTKSSYTAMISQGIFTNDSVYAQCVCCTA